MKSIISILILVLVCLVAMSGRLIALDEDALEAWTFEEPGSLPEGWVVEATNRVSQLAVWDVQEDETAPEGSSILSLTEIKDRNNGVFNLCWRAQSKFLNGFIQVKMRANTGRVDQGGGLVWRMQDANNYYIVRYNPLESNYRLYHVKDGRRTKLAGFGGLPWKVGAWVSLGVRHRGNTIECFINGKKVLDCVDDTFTEAGGIGVWTKADAATSFDELTVRHEANAIRAMFDDAEVLIQSNLKRYDGYLLFKRIVAEYESETKLVSLSQARIVDIENNHADYLKIAQTLITEAETIIDALASAGMMLPREDADKHRTALETIRDKSNCSYLRNLTELTLSKLNTSMEGRGFLAVQPETRAIIGGVRLIYVQANGPAGLSGLKSGDRIIKINDTDIDSFVDLKNIIPNFKPGEQATFIIERGDETLTIKVQFGRVVE